MGKKGSWFSTVKKAFAQSTEKNKETKQTEVDKDDADLNNETYNNDTTLTSSEAKLNEQIAANTIQTAFRNHSFRRSTSNVNEEDSQAAVTELGHPTSKLDEEKAATIIQTVVRRYLSKHNNPITTMKNAESVSKINHPIDTNVDVRSESNDEVEGEVQAASQETMGTKTSEALNGLRRIKSFAEGECIKGETKIPKRMQSLSPTFSRNHSQRPKLSEELVSQRKLPKHDKGLDKFKIEVFDISPKSKEQIKAKMNHNQEAAMRREKALAFASNVQQAWRNSKNSKSSSSTIIKKPKKSHLDRSYSERVSQPREAKNTIKRFNSLSIKGEIDWNNGHNIQDLSLDNKTSIAPLMPRCQSSFTSTRRTHGS